MYRNIKNKSACSVLKLLVFSALTLYYSNQSYAQTQVELDLEKVIAIAKNQNLEIKSASVDHHISLEDIRERQEDRLPNVQLHALYSRVTNISEFQNGIKHKPTVTRINPEIYDLTSNFNVPIYNGNKINNQIKIAKIAAEIAHYQEAETINTVYLQSAFIFLEICKLQELQKLIIESVSEEKDRLKEVTVLYEKGVITKNEIYRAELQLAQREFQFLTNTKNINVLLKELKTVLQLPENSQIIINEKSIEKINTEVNSYAELKKYASNNESILISEEHLKIKQLELTNVKSNYLPKVNGFGHFGFKYPNYMFFPPTDYLYTFGQIGIEATWDLSTLYKNRVKVETAKNKVHKQEIENKILQDKIDNLIFSQYADYQDLIEKIEVTNKAEILAEENYRIVNVQYLNQMVLITEMLDADNAKLKAKFDVIANKIDILQKKYEILHTTNLIAHQ